MLSYCAAAADSATFAEVDERGEGLPSICQAEKYSDDRNNGAY